MKTSLYNDKMAKKEEVKNACTHKASETYRRNAPFQQCAYFKWLYKLYTLFRSRYVYNINMLSSMLELLVCYFVAVYVCFFWFAFTSLGKHEWITLYEAYSIDHESFAQQRSICWILHIFILLSEWNEWKTERKRIGEHTHTEIKYQTNENILRCLLKSTLFPLIPYDNMFNIFILSFQKLK